MFAIGSSLGITKRLAGLAAKMGVAMESRGLTDPFVLLTERPEQVSRWSRKRSHRDAGDEHGRAS